MSSDLAVYKLAPFHGWKILGLSTFAQFISVGFTVYLIGVFIQPLSDYFNVSPGYFGWGAAVFYLTAGLAGPLLGYWVDKGLVRWVLTAGAIFLALGFILMALSPNLLVLTLACVFFLAPGASMVGVVPCNAMIVSWFERRRGFALGIAAAGISLGGFLMPPVSAGLIEAIGWRHTMHLLGATIAVLLVPAAWMLAVSRPSDLNQFPDGQQPGEQHAGRPGQESVDSFRAFLGHPAFWLVTVAVGMLSLCSVFMITYVIPFARESGLDLQRSSLLLSLYAGSAFVGKFVCGWVIDHVPAKTVLISILVLAAMGWSQMFWFEGVVGLILSAIVVGWSVGGLMPTWAALIALYFGPGAYGRVKGAMSVAMIACSVLPGPLGAYIYSAYGSYAIGFSMVGWVLFVGIASACLLPNPKTVEDF